MFELFLRNRHNPNILNSDNNLYDKDLNDELKMQKKVFEKSNKLCQICKVEKGKYISE